MVGEHVEQLRILIISTNLQSDFAYICCIDLLTIFPVIAQPGLCFRIFHFNKFDKVLKLLTNEFLLFQEHGLLGLKMISVFLLIISQSLFELLDLPHLKQYVQIVFFFELLEWLGLCAFRASVFVRF